MYLFIHRYDGPDTGPSKASQWPRPKQVENTVAELLFRFSTRLSVAAYQVTRIQVNYEAEGTSSDNSLVTERDIRKEQDFYRPSPLFYLIYHICYD